MSLVFSTSGSGTVALPVVRTSVLASKHVFELPSWWLTPMFVHLLSWLEKKPHSFICPSTFLDIISLGPILTSWYLQCLLGICLESRILCTQINLNGPTWMTILLPWVVLYFGFFSYPLLPMATDYTVWGLIVLVVQPLCFPVLCTHTKGQVVPYPKRNTTEQRTRGAAQNLLFFP